MFLYFFGTIGSIAQETKLFHTLQTQFFCFYNSGLIAYDSLQVYIEENINKILIIVGISFDIFRYLIATVFFSFSL